MHRCVSVVARQVAPSNPRRITGHEIGFPYEKWSEPVLDDACPNTIFICSVQAKNLCIKALMQRSVRNGKRFLPTGLDELLRRTFGCQRLFNGAGVCGNVGTVTCNLFWHEKMRRLASRAR